MYANDQIAKIELTTVIVHCFLKGFLEKHQNLPEGLLSSEFCVTWKDGWSLLKLPQQVREPGYKTQKHALSE
jgi:hypothetical protein